MRNALFFSSKLIILLIVILFSGCEKKDKDKYYGIDTIDNTLYGSQFYYALGFSFETGSERSTIESPPPDITIHVGTDIHGNITSKYANTPNLIESFALAASLDTPEEAKESFNNLRDPGSPVWSLSAAELEENQVWLFKTSEGNLVKFRVIELNTDNSINPPKVEMKFEWRLQPGGSSIFTS